MEFDLQDVKKIDPQDMYSKIFDFPLQLREGYTLKITNGIDQFDCSGIRNIVVAGMGGSAIGGDLLRSYLSPELEIPIFINRNYSLPKFVDEQTLVIASSYSGNTEETLAAYGEAKKRGAKLFVATTGGKLGELAEKEKCYRVTLPGGFQPRAALGYSFGPLLHFVQKLGFVPDQSQIVNSTCDFLADSRLSLSLSIPREENPAKQIALAIKDKITLIYGGADFYDTVAVRAKGQICENAKQLAFANVCPEFNHNELVGFEYPEKLLSNVVALILIGPGDLPGVRKRFKIVDTILSEKNIETIVINAIGPNRLAAIFSLIQISDFVSYYLAILNEVDPSPVVVIDRLKSELEKSV